MKYARLLLTSLLFSAAAAAQQGVPTPAPNPVQAPTPAAAQAAAAAAATAAPERRSEPVGGARFEKGPVIDGRLDDEVWKEAAVLKDFYQTYPGDNTKPSRPTEVLLGYDARHLYIGFRAYDEPGNVRATVAKRDDVLEDDNIRVYLDTFNDQRRAYVLVFNPLGVQQDGIYTEGSGEDYTVDILMESKGMVTPDGYTVEVAIPFKSLRYRAGKGSRWGFQALRRIKHLNNEQDSWTPITRGNSRFLGQQGFITGLEGISAGRTLELIPSLTLSETGARVRSLPPDSPAPDPGRFVNRAVEFDPGLTAKLGITPEVTLDLALNPDFAQVESDQLVVTANQRFPIFFEEKRPFFLEGIDIFQTPLQPVHTRTIVDPDYAVKLTGKRGRNTFGLMFASDNAPGNFTSEERDEIGANVAAGIADNRVRFLDKNAYQGVLRLKRDVGKENSIGFTATTYNFIERHNDLAGFDGRFRLNERTAVRFQVLGTTTRRLFRDLDRGGRTYRVGNGFGYFADIESTGRNFSSACSFEGRTHFYTADLGFTRRTNSNAHNCLFAYASDPDGKARLVSWRIHNFTETNFDWQGRSQFFQNSTELKLNFQRQSYAAFGFQKGYERVFEEEFGTRRGAFSSGAFIGDDPERSAYRKTFYVYGSTTPSKKYYFFTEVDYIFGAFDFDFGAGPKFPRVSPAALLDPDAPFDPGPGNELVIDSQFVYLPVDTARISLNYRKDRLVRRDTGLVAFDDNIYALRGTYQFTRFVSVRARIDYSTLAANVRGQFLFAWTPNPGTALYVGYNNDLNRNGFSPFTGQLEPGFRRNGQVFFIKMSYLIRRGF
jgi:Domain of unknown function (DUF5916)/Carbohydrate family 9 binding domain-like